MITFTRNTNTVKMANDGTAVYLAPDLSINGEIGGKVIYFSIGPLDYQRKNTVLSIAVLSIQGRPNDNAPDVADWLATNYFYGHNYGGGGGGSWPLDYSTSGKQDTIIAEIQDVEGKLDGGQISALYDSKQIIRHVGGILDGKINYIAYKTGGIAGTEVARKTLNYDGSANLTGIVVT